MAYTIRKTAKIQEELILENEDGTVYKTLAVDIDVDSVFGKYNKYCVELDRARQTNDADAMGESIVNITRLIFGDDQAAELLNFYDGRRVKMLIDIFPFIQDCVGPKLNAAYKGYVQKMKAAKR